ncbi:MAG: protein kinase [Myxococcota bacterium]
MKAVGATKTAHPVAKGKAAERRDFIGRVFGSYRLKGRLGSGGIGDVYAAEHVRTGRPYAVKVLHETNAQSLRRFRREAEALAAIGHEGVVAVHDFDTTEDGIAFLVMEQLKGEDLKARLARGALTTHEAFRIFDEVAGALEAAHTAGVLHRDLKPSNVFLRHTHRGVRAVLLDFGLAKATDGLETTLTASGRVLGTPAYMSPEQALGEDVDERTDVYSLAVVLYEMLAGYTPFAGRNVTAILLSKVLTSRVRSLRDGGVSICTGADQAILKAMATERSARPTSVAAFRQAVTATLDVGTPCEAPQPSALLGAADETLPPGGLPNLGTKSEALDTRSRTGIVPSARLGRLLAASVALGTLLLTAGVSLSAPHEAPAVAAANTQAHEVSPAQPTFAPAPTPDAEPVPIAVVEPFDTSDESSAPLGPSEPRPDEPVEGEAVEAVQEAPRRRPRPRPRRRPAPATPVPEAPAPASPAAVMPGAPPASVLQAMARNYESMRAILRTRIDDFDALDREITLVRSKGADPSTVCSRPIGLTLNANTAGLGYHRSELADARDTLCSAATPAASQAYLSALDDLQASGRQVAGAFRAELARMEGR